MAEEKFPTQFYERCLSYYRSHQPCTWPQAQAAVQNYEAREQHQYAAEAEVEHYARALPAASPDERFEDALEYQRRNPHLSFEQAAAALGEATTFVDVPVALDASGLAVDRPTRYDYARQPPKGKFAEAELMAVATELDCTMDEAAKFLDHYLGLIREGKPHDTSWAESTAAVFGPPGHQHKPPKSTEMDSHPAAPKHNRVAGQATSASGEPGFFAPSTDPWGTSHATSAPTGETSMPAFKASSRTGRSRAAQAIPQPAGPGLSPAGYSRQQHEEMTEQRLQEVLGHMREKRCSFEEAQHYIDQQLKLRMAKKLGAAIGKKPLPADAPVGPPRQDHASGYGAVYYERGGAKLTKTVRPCPDGGWIEEYA
jgi:hypothetical protein